METTFCFVSDIDWAPEHEIKFLLDFFKRENIPLTVFVTHKSKIVEEYYSDKRRYVGLHFNFWKDSTQGRTQNEIIENVQALWKDAKGFRNHRWFMNLTASKKLFQKGLNYDSTARMFLQPNIEPYLESTGLIQFPVFFEDMWYKGNEFRLQPLVKRLNSDGLKIMDFHPVHAYYNSEICLFLLEVLHFVKRKKYRCVYLDDLYMESLK